MPLPTKKAMRVKRAPAAHLRLQQRRVLFSRFMPAVRFLSATLLVVSLVVGGYRFITRPPATGALIFTPHNIASQSGVLGVAAADMDNDGKMEVVAAGSQGVRIYTQKQTTGSFAQQVIDSSVSGNRVQLVDLTGNGLQDILVTMKSGTPSVAWYENKGNLSFVRQYIGTGSEGKAYAADLNNNGHIDIVTATTEGGSVVLRRWMNNGSGTFTSSTLATNTGITAVTAGNVRGGDYSDIIVGGSAGLHIWYTNNGSSWSKSDIDTTHKSYTDIAIGDMTGNGNNDIVIGNQHGNTIALYKNANGTSFDRTVISHNTNVATLLVADLDEDTNMDIIATGQSAGRVLWFKNRGNNTFIEQTLVGDLQSVIAVGVADINGNGKLDFVTASHTHGVFNWYERIGARPIATAPSNIRQMTDGSGRIIFETTISDPDFNPTSARIQYSLNGDHWHKPWLLSVQVSAGSVDLRNSNGYQVGTANPINTNSHDSVTLTLVWDTKSIENTNGPLIGDIGTVQLRVIPRNAMGNGMAAVSPRFRVDNAAPAGGGNFRVVNKNDTQVGFGWNKPADSSNFTYRLYYGTNHAAVLEQRSQVWDGSNSAALNDPNTTATIVPGLTPNTRYSFKLFMTDAFGNTRGFPSTQTVTLAAPPPDAPPPGDDPAASPTIGPPLPPTPTVPAEPTPTPTSTPIFPTISPPPTPSPTATPPIFEENRLPIADAGLPQTVNPSALVVLDGTGSYDPDGGNLSYEWRQISGPEVELTSVRTATPAFTAGGENETYIFSLVVQDVEGETASDQVTVATRVLDDTPDATPVVTIEPTPEIPEFIDQPPLLVSGFLRPLDFILFFFSLVSTGISLGERLARIWHDRNAKDAKALFTGDQSNAKGRVVHYKTGEPIAGAQVLVYGADGKLRDTERTNNKGEFATLFPAGEYTLGVQMQGFTFAPAASKLIKPETGILYTGGKIRVEDSSKPLEVVVPMKPTAGEVASARVQLLHFWQAVQRIGRILSWPIFIAGAVINTILIFWTPNTLYLLIEILYVVLVIVKVALEVRVRPAYGLVRDAITHVPLDLAVVRLFEQGSNRLIMTRVTNAQGKFFALPPSGTYTVTVTKPGYAVFSKDKVEITSDHDSVLQVTADLMPVAPQGGLQQARAAVL